MKERQRPFVLGLSVVACVIVFVLWRPGSMPQLPKASVAPAEATPTPTPPQTLTASLKPAAPSFAVSTANQDIIRACFDKKKHMPSVHYGAGLKLSDVVKDLMGNSAFAPENLVTNIHITKPDGTLQRLHTEPHDKESKGSPSRWTVGASDVRIFDVDSQGLPIDVPFPAALKLEAMKSIVDNFESQGTVTFNEKRFHETFAQGLAADIVETDGHVNELQVFFDGNSLGCAWAQGDLSCKCL